MQNIFCPQVGKTGAYLHFSWLLHSMLLRLKRVDVYDNRVSYAPALDPMEICGIEALHHPQWPDVTKVSETEFITEFLDSEFKSFSRVHISSVIKETKPNKKQEVRMLKRTSDVTDIGGQQVIPVILADCASHDTLHHCDSCKFYREGMGGDTTKVLDYQVKDFGDESCEVCKLALFQFCSRANFVSFAVDDSSKILSNINYRLWWYVRG